MNLGTILVKTDKGRAEGAGRSEVNSPAQRRLLILVDGRKTMNHPGEFARVRGEAVAFIRERVGDTGRAVCTAIERSTSPQELRLVLRGIETFVQQRLDHNGTQAFARHFGACCSDITHRRMELPCP